MPTKNTLILQEIRSGIKVYYNPYYCRTEYHLQDGRIVILKRK